MHPKAAQPAIPGAETHTQQEGHQHGHQDAGGAQQRSTPSIQALAGVRVVASLLGHSHKQKKNTRCVLVPKHRWNTWTAQPARPRAQITHTEARPSQVWGEQQKEGPSAMSGEGQTPEWQCAIGGIQDDVKDGKTAGGARIQNTEHNSPPSPSGGTCSGVPARPQRPGHAVFSCQSIGGPKVP